MKSLVLDEVWLELGYLLRPASAGACVRRVRANGFRDGRWLSNSAAGQLFPTQGFFAIFKSADKRALASCCRQSCEAPSWKTSSPSLYLWQVVSEIWTGASLQSVPNLDHLTSLNRAQS